MAYIILNTDNKDFKTDITDVNYYGNEAALHTSLVKAMNQIHEKLYGYDFDPEYRKNMLLVGINYDKKTKKHECIIETFQDN